jgi:hypothetical protein
LDVIREETCSLHFGVCGLFVGMKPLFCLASFDIAMPVSDVCFTTTIFGGKAGKVNFERGPLFGLTVNFDMSPIRSDNLIADGQSQAFTLPGCLGGKKWFIDSGDVSKERISRTKSSG